uniref:Glyco_hydro_38C domain-containing protein n=1 Tax=Panagrellus redivivus TaxID=6233 RepID=A0A7E4VMR5_PANRE
MVFEFCDTVELSIPTFLLNFTEELQFIATPKREIKGLDNAFWRLNCEPNVRGKLAFSIRSSVGSLKVYCTFGIKGTDLQVKKADDAKPFALYCREYEFISHQKLGALKLLSEDVIIATCQIKFFEIPATPIAQCIFASSHISFSFSKAEFQNAGQNKYVETEKRKAKNCKTAEWWIRYYPNGQSAGEEFDVEVKSSANIEKKYATVSFDYKGVVISTPLPWSIKKAQLAAIAENGMIRMTSTAVFEVPPEEWEPTEERSPAEGYRFDFSKGVQLQLSTELCNEEYFGDFQSSENAIALESNNIGYRLRVHPAGDRNFNKGFVSVFVDALPDSKSSGLLLAAVRITDIRGIESFYFTAQPNSSYCMSRFLSHDKIKALNLSTLNFECVAVSVDHPLN